MSENKSNEFINTTVQPTKRRGPEVGMDTGKSIVGNILDAIEIGSFNASEINSLMQTAQTREQTYELIDSMAQDDVIAAVLETYAEDTVETDENGKSVWAESESTDVLDYVQWLLNSLNINKKIYQWAYCLVTYGDVYVRLFRESDVQDDVLFNNAPRKRLNEQFAEEKERIKKDKLQEDVKLRVYLPGDRYLPYVQMVDNPAEMFDLQKFGKTYGYIKTPINIVQSSPDRLYDYLTRYSVKQQDTEIFDATCFVHGCLENTNQRQPETIDIFLDNGENETKGEDGLTHSADSMTASYTVKRGQSILYNIFKIWREMNLLELSALLNRLTKSSLVRIITIDTGDMPKEQVASFLQRLKEKIEQKSAINTNKGMQDYTAAGPIENTIYVPVHGNQGNITVQNVGGDFDPKSLVDLEYFRDKLFGALKVPKQYFGQTGDSAGFDGGKSLSLLSSRYGKTIKRLQAVLCQVVTDIVNLFLIDRGMNNYVNKFKIKMQMPVTQEELDKRANLDTRLRYVGDIMNQLGDVEDKAVKLKIYRSLIQNVITDNNVIKELDEYIKTLEKNKKNEDEAESTDKEGLPNLSGFGKEITRETETPVEEDVQLEDKQLINEDSKDEDEDSYLPTPEELGLGD